MAKSREVRKLDQKRATSSIDSGYDAPFGRLHSWPADRQARPSEAHRPAAQIGLVKARSDLAGGIGELVADSAIGNGDAGVDGRSGRQRLQG